MWREDYAAICGRGCLCVIINRLRILLGKSKYREDRVGTGTEGLKRPQPRAGRVKTECQKRFVSLKSRLEKCTTVFIHSSCPPLCVYSSFLESVANI